MLQEENYGAVENEYVDETLVCKDCGNEFVFTAGEQKFYAEKGFLNKPKACKACRDGFEPCGQEQDCFPCVVQVTNEVS